MTVEAGGGRRMILGVCVNLTLGGEETLATLAYHSWLARVPLPLGAAVNKIKGATLTPPIAQARTLRASASLAPGIAIQLVLGSVVQLQSLSLSSTVAGSVACGGGGIMPLSLANSKSIGWSHQKGRTGKPLFCTAPAQSSQIGGLTMKFATVCR
jgi:hypothetical protein